MTSLITLNKQSQALPVHQAPHTTTLHKTAGSLNILDSMGFLISPENTDYLCLPLSHTLANIDKYSLSLPLCLSLSLSLTHTVVINTHCWPAAVSRWSLTSNLQRRTEPPSYFILVAHTDVLMPVCVCVDEERPTHPPRVLNSTSSKLD